MAATKPTVKQRLRSEAALFLGLFFCGLVLLPIAIYLVGAKVFGGYGEAGFSGFFGTISSQVRNGNPVTWFLVLSPYLVWQILRLTALAWRHAGRLTSDGGSSAV